nr:group II intron maturase-specific domain-containing protein [Desulfogranum japonicum]
MGCKSPVCNPCYCRDDRNINTSRKQVSEVRESEVMSRRTKTAHKAEALRGWMGYFGISELYRPIPELNRWLRRRVRMCYWINLWQFDIFMFSIG